ncbi:MAG: hypothetical protein J6Y13_04855, partial [Treponema sp.]|nr:hypothetical protein [Treponema sp.]
MAYTRHRSTDGSEESQVEKDEGMQDTAEEAGQQAAESDAAPKVKRRRVVRKSSAGTEGAAPGESDPGLPPADADNGQASLFGTSDAAASNASAAAAYNSNPSDSDANASQTSVSDLSYDQSAGDQQEAGKAEGDPGAREGRPYPGSGNFQGHYQRRNWD